MFLQAKEEVKKWLDCYGIKNYIINDDLSVDVDGDIDLYDKRLTTIPIKFNIVTGNFNCSYNNLTTLQFAPEIVGGDFSCSNNKLTSLQFAPEKVGGDFYCDNNKLTSLQGAPKNKLKQIIETYPDLIHTVSTEDLLQII